MFAATHTLARMAFNPELFNSRPGFFYASGLDAAVLEDGRDIGLPGLAAGDRAEDHERRDHESCASNE